MTDMLDEVRASIELYAKQWRNIERMRIGIDQQCDRFQKDNGLPEVVMPWREAATGDLKKVENHLSRTIAKLGRETVYHEWVEDSLGLGVRVYYLIGNLPPIPDFPNPAKLWKYMGLHPEGAKGRERGVFLGYSSELKACALYWIGLQCVKQMDSPYRWLYDKRRAQHEILALSEIVPGECTTCDEAVGKNKKRRASRNLERERTGMWPDCKNLGGPHWSKGHSHSDALRYMTKQIIVDLWRVGHGKAPTFGQNVSEVQGSVALVGAV